MSRRFLTAAFLALVLVACTETVQGTGDDGNGNDDDSSSSTNTSRTTLDAPSVCRLLVSECQAIADSMGECIAAYEALRVSAKCTELARTATCSDIADLEATCFPPCSTSTTNCHDDGTITLCSEGATLTFSCSGICKNSGASYTGTCGTESPLGDTSASPKCWCE